MDLNENVRRPLSLSASAGFLLATLLLAGCKGRVMEGEKQARQQVQAVAGSYRPDRRRPELPEIGRAHV